jgi:predicted amidohydrolase YtcJ
MPYLSSAPDLVLHSGTIHTMDARDSTAPAIAIAGGRITGAGSDDEMRGLAGLGTVVESLEGRVVVPGLIDAHNHLLATGRMLAHVQLFDCRSIGEVVERVAASCRAAPPGAWVLGRGWDESLLAERRHPTRDDLDPVSAGHPVVLHRVWNQLVANSRAMELAGIGRDTPDPSPDEAYSGSFERDAASDPTGLFRDRAKELILRHVSPLSATDEVGAIEAACAAYNAVGLTGVAEPGLYPAETRAFHQAALDGRLTVRVDMLLAGWGFGTVADEPGLKTRFEALGLRGGFGNELLRIEGIKFMPDGGVGDRTARMFEPYLDEPGNRGQWVVDPVELPALIRWVHDLGFSIDTHTCGDEAQQVVVQAYAAALEANPNPRLRHRVHHAYFPTRRSLELMARHRIPAVVSNPFITNLGESFVLSLGEERAARAMPMRTYLDAGIPLAGSSDSHVSDYNPWVGMYGATTRKTVTGRVLGPEERITAREALRSYTIGGAYVTGREKLTGSLEPGKLADLVLLDQDPLAIDPSDLKDLKPLATMIGGRWVFDRR